MDRSRSVKTVKSSAVARIPSRRRITRKKAKDSCNFLCMPQVARRALLKRKRRKMMSSQVRWCCKSTQRTILLAARLVVKRRWISCSMTLTRYQYHSVTNKCSVSITGRKVQILSTSIITSSYRKRTKSRVKSCSQKPPILTMRKRTNCRWVKFA